MWKAPGKKKAKNKLSLPSCLLTGSQQDSMHPSDAANVEFSLDIAEALIIQIPLWEQISSKYKAGILQSALTPSSQLTTK